ncbi:MarR family winged helix-turn-helix transcriptional regulator [Kocuria sp. M1N1S27]|uniref:MarR family winged helix-turn-helix transcriptional regulator n=1 Tax=Kocuria kalidii TaxID=3376283 RepID=UPI00378A33C2
MPVSHDTAVELVRDLLELQRVMKRVTKTDAGQRRLNPTAIALLYYLAGSGARRATVMASETGLGPSGLSRQLAGLEEAGLVERSPDPEDGRAALVAITERGREQARAVLEQDAQRLAVRLEDWDEDRARASRGAINEITSVFLSSLGEERTTSCPGHGEDTAPEHRDTTDREHTDHEHTDREHEEGTTG